MASEYQEFYLQAGIALVSLIAGVLIAKINNKTGIFSYHWSSNRIALSANDSIFGDVRATWQGVPVRNLHMFTFEVENSSTRDYENVELRVYSGVGTQILNEKTEIVDTPYIVPLSEQYLARQRVPADCEPTQQQLDAHHSNREYKLRAFNRGQKLRFSYICTRPDDDELPMLFIATPSRGVRMKLVHSPAVVLKPMWGVPVPVALVRAFIVSTLVVVASSLYFKNVVAASVVCMVVGLTAQIFGAALYKAERYFRNFVSG